MTLLAVERIKLLSTRSPWWCIALIVVLGLAVAVPFALALQGVTPATTQFGLVLGSYVAMVLAALAVTTEYRFGTIRASFVAVPNRTAVLVAKTVFVTAVVGLVGLAVAFAAWALAIPLAGEAGQLALNSPVDWRATAGQGLIYAGYAIIAIGVGMLVRHTAAAISILLVWALVVQTVVAGVSAAVGVNIIGWMPFANASNFVSAGDPKATGAAFGSPTFDYAFSGPWGSLGYFFLICVAVWLIGLAVTLRRDA